MEGNEVPPEGGRGLPEDFRDPSLESLRIDEVELPTERPWTPPNAPEERGSGSGDSPAVESNGNESPRSDSELPEPSSDSNVHEFRSPRASKASKTFRSMGNRVNTESTRARAEEVNSGSKIVPKVEQEIGDFFGVEIELAAWFAASGKDVAVWVDELDASHDSPVRAELHRLLVHRDVAAVSAAVAKLMKSVKEDLAWVSDGVIDSDDYAATFDDHTLLFVRLCALHASGADPLLANGVALLETLFKQISRMRWFAEFEADEEGHTSLYVSRLFMLSRMAMFATFGESQAVNETESAVWKQHGLELPQNEDDYASPVNYMAFIDDIASRYPAYIHGLDDEVHNRGTRLRRGIKSGRGAPEKQYDPVDPRDLVGGRPGVMPYVPHSIVEASELYKSRVRTTPAIEQLLEEQMINLALSEPAETPKGPANKAKEIKSNSRIAAVQQLYKNTLRVQKSVCSVAVELIMHVGNEGPGPRVHSVLATLWFLLRWFRVGHVLMFEHLAALLFDCQFHLLAHLFCSNHSQIAAVIQEPYVTDVLGGAASWGDLPAGIWALVTGPAAGPPAVYDGPELIWPMYDAVQLAIPHVNKFNLQTFTHLLGISRFMVTGKTQRLLVVAELSVDAFKPLLSVNEPEMWKQLLQYLKAQVPFTGKRWRYLNMEIISAIYLHCSSGIDDNWLSGNDVTQAVRDAAAEEAALRDLVEQYNVRIEATSEK